MLKLCILVTSTVLGYVFWWGADAYLHSSFFGAFIWSSVGSIVGCWLGWWLHERYLR